MLTISHRAGEDGKLFGSVTTKEIAEAIARPAACASTARGSGSTTRSARSGTYMVEVEIGGGGHASVKTIVAEAEVAAEFLP